MEGTEHIDEDTSAAKVPIAAIGASAGGLEALRQLFSELPDDTGLAFVVIQHLDPSHASTLANVLAGIVQMPVTEIAVPVRAEPNCVYVIPSDGDLGIEHGIISKVPRDQTAKLHLPIDAFFCALAADSAVRPIGVVLSGSASDGTAGLQAIKAAGGITFAQEPASAQFRSMPESALAAGVVDFRLNPEAIGREIAQLARHAYLTSATLELRPPDSGGDDERSRGRILSALRQHAQLDFRSYKRATVMRRIARRMALRHVASLSEYADVVGREPEESKALAQDILIHVTSFFRNPAAFEALKRQVFPALLADKGPDATVRVWVPGCSSGEEAYSLAMCLVEFFADEGRTPSLKIFGSDLSERAIQAARAGLYSEAALAGVSAERRARFFERTEGRYRIGKQIRELCVFVRHDLTQDPPFARLDLISCRNVLIYFDAELQRRVLPLLHHCLNPSGCLFLGGSETIREFGALFAAIDKEHRFFRKTGESPRMEYLQAIGREAESKLPSFPLISSPQLARDAQRQADHVLLARYAPAGVIVNERLEVTQFRGRTGDFLEPPPGQPQTNLLRLVRDGLVTPLREAFEAAKGQFGPIRRPGVRVTHAEPSRVIDLEVVPLASVATTTDPYFLVLFEEVTSSAEAPREVAPATRPASTDQRDEELARLRTELAAARDFLRAVTAEHQDTAEELGAANEELVAANEELQSANEELQSAKEELQSANEELSTLNDELTSRNEQLDLVASDLINVLESVQIPVIIVDRDLRIRRFTPAAREIARIRPGDVGRLLDDVKLNVQVDDLLGRVVKTIESATPNEQEVQGVDGRWFKLHIRPCRTVDNRVDGAALSFLDVDVMKRALQEAERLRDYAASIVETVPMALAVIDKGSRIRLANPPFFRKFYGHTDSAEHPELFEIGDRVLDVPALREAINRGLAVREGFHDLEIQCNYPVVGRRCLVVAGCPIVNAAGDAMFLLVVEDTTKRHLLEASEKQARVEAEQANRAKDLFLATLSHELRTPLSTILISAQMLKRSSTDDPKIRRASSAIERAVGAQARLIEDLLDISRIVSGKLMLDLQAVDFTGVVQAAVDIAQASTEAKGLGLELFVDGKLRTLHGDPDRLQQVVTNLLNNAIKFTPAGGTITVALRAVGETATLTVKDTGLGMRAEIIPHLFDRFVQAESAMTRTHGGLGLGLAIVRHIVNVHGGEVRAESPGEGQGATFTVILPLANFDRAAVRSRGRNTGSRSIRGIRVLLVEDETDTREACAAMLEEQGAEVRSAGSVAEGLAALGTFTPQVILCDIAMPGEDGYEFIRKLRSGALRAEIPAAALTALTGEEDRRRALASGFQMHLGKPIDADRLATAVATLAAQPAPTERWGTSLESVAPAASNGERQTPSHS